MPVAEPLRLTYPEYTVITVARSWNCRRGHCRPARRARSSQAPVSHQAEIYLIEFPDPWCVVPLRDDIVLSDDDELCRLATEEFANGTYEQREAMIETVRQAHLRIRADLIAEVGEKMVGLMSKLPEVMDDAIGPEGQRIAEGDDGYRPVPARVVEG